jgi:hypothetical protein
MWVVPELVCLSMQQKAPRRFQALEQSAHGLFRRILLCCLDINFIVPGQVTSIRFNMVGFVDLKFLLQHRSEPNYVNTHRAANSVIHPPEGLASRRCI